ncbi:plasmid mobilization protein [Kitasatospora sp. HPMI-4]|uniref:plasmid mobilization protein n=1 Tax=Kitasatospora sp. HPMI-4 TaxID=3448443 RepID=UPI003F1E21F3
MRAPGDQHSHGHQGAPRRGEAAGDRDTPPASEPAFPNRRPRRRTYQPTHREDVIASRLTAAEKAEITAAAKRAGMYPSGYLAAAGLAAARGATSLKPNEQLDAAIDELAALRTQISRVGNNVNQIAYIHNSGGQVRRGELEHTLTALTHALARVDDAADALVKKRT